MLLGVPKVNVLLVSKVPPPVNPLPAVRVIVLFAFVFNPFVSSDFVANRSCAQEVVAYALKFKNLRSIDSP
ncbi:MAG: hypothetical protein J6V44_12000 [Methanobrevibacter sp.]|nr:hypothetical protein [Methanobrevibacter sp.]